MGPDSGGSVESGRDTGPLKPTGSETEANWNPAQVVACLGIMATAIVWSLHVVSFFDVKNLALWLGCVLLWAVQTALGRRDTSGFLVLGRCWIALCVLVAVGLIVAPVGSFVLAEGLRSAGLLLFVSLAYPEFRGGADQGKLLTPLVAAAGICAALALLQYSGVASRLFPVYPHYDQALYSVFGNQGLLGGFLAMGLTALAGWVTLGTRRGGRRWMTAMGAVAGLMAVALLLSASRAALLSLAAGILGLLLAHRAQGTSRALVISAGCFGALLAVWMVAGGGFSRWAGTLSASDTGGNLRLWVWRAGWDMVMARPILGAGWGNFVYAAPPYLGPHTPAGLAEAALQTTYHAHFDLLEYLVETGGLGLALAVWVFLRLRVRSRIAIAVGMAFAAFSLFYPAWYSTPHGLVGLWCLALNLPRPIAGRACPRLHGWAGAGSLAGCVLFTVLVFYPSFLLRRAEDRHLSGQAALEAYQRATDTPGRSPEAFESFGIYLLEQGEFDRARAALSRAQAGLNTGRVYALLGMAAAAQGDRVAACEHYRGCLERWPHARDVQVRVAEMCPDVPAP